MIDSRLVFLERAAARLMLIEAGAMSLDEAFDGLMPAIFKVADCRCYREFLDSLDRHPPRTARKLTKELRKALRGNSAPVAGFEGPIIYPKLTY